MIDPYLIEKRLRTIATNAIREARVIYSIDAGPWFDDHAERLELIFQQLHIATEGVNGYEHYALAASEAPKENPSLRAVAEALDSVPVEVKKVDVTPKFKIPSEKITT